MKIGFQKAMSAILDGNITTIASVVLMALGSTVKGFAYTLMIGIILSLLHDQIHSVLCIGTERVKNFTVVQKRERALILLEKKQYSLQFPVSLSLPD